MPRIQIITIILSILLLLFIARLIIKGRLREEYAKLQDQNKRLTQELANMRARQQSSEKENAA